MILGLAKYDEIVDTIGLLTMTHTFHVIVEVLFSLILQDYCFYYNAETIARFNVLCRQGLCVFFMFLPFLLKK